MLLKVFCSFSNGQKFKLLQSRVDFLKCTDYCNFRTASLDVRVHNCRDRGELLMLSDLWKAAEMKNDWKFVDGQEGEEK